MIILLLILERRVVITAIASDPIAAMRRPIEGAPCDPSREALRQIRAHPLYVAPMLLGAGSGSRCLTQLLSRKALGPPSLR